jgi:hypothetical protein
MERSSKSGPGRPATPHSLSQFPHGNPPRRTNALHTAALVACKGVVQVDIDAAITNLANAFNPPLPTCAVTPADLSGFPDLQ